VASGWENASVPTTLRGRLSVTPSKTFPPPSLASAQQYLAKPSKGKLDFASLNSKSPPPQARLRQKGLAVSTIDRVIHSALRGMLRDAELTGYRTSDLQRIFDRRFVTRLDQGSGAAEIDPFTDDEREKILEWFLENRSEYHAFVYFRFWTGTRPSALRWGDIDPPGRRVRIRRSRVLGKDGRPKTGRSKRDVIVHEGLDEILGSHAPERPDP